MRVQHPSKTQHTIAPAGGTQVTTDERGIAEVSDQIGKSLLKQGWTELKSGKSAEKE